MSEVNVWKILNVQARVSYAQKKAKELRYFKLHHSRTKRTSMSVWVKLCVSHGNDCMKR
jgi:hypothetical protein